MTLLDRPALFRLTTSSVRDRCPPPRPDEVNGRGKPIVQKIYWDAELAGFGLLVGRRTKTFIVQKDVHGRSVRVSIGRLGAWTADMARKRARELLVEMDQGVNPNQESRKAAARGTTLAQAVEMHAAAMRAKGNVPRSILTLEDETKRHFSDWMARPLAEITRNECAKRHEQITKNSGRYAANRAFWLFRASYNTAARRMDDLPPNPTRGVTFNRMERRREPIPWEELPAWRKKVDGLQNPLRRDLQLFLLLTGLRSEDARTVRWEHVDLAKKTLHRPKPKGGVDRAFTVPIAGVVVEILERRKAENRMLFPVDEGWAFPTKNAEGRVTYVQETKEYRDAPDGKRVKFLPSAHRLRDTFASAAHEAGVGWIDLKVLMNHTLPSGGDVTAGYIRPSVEHLREAVERVTAFLVEKMRAPGSVA